MAVPEFPEINYTPIEVISTDDVYSLVNHSLIGVIRSLRTTKVRLIPDQVPQIPSFPAEPYDWQHEDADSAVHAATAVETQSKLVHGVGNSALHLTALPEMFTSV
jgi:hypothetical protein